jgi:hypothetical protein
MDFDKIIQSQYLASLEMLAAVVQGCPQSLWEHPEPKNKFWHIAYHALFYTHLYLQPSAGDFTYWEKHREGYEFMGPTPWPPYEQPEIGQPYTPVEVLEYIDFCRNQVRDILPRLDLTSEQSGFDWLPFGKFELQFYNIRHLQQHTGELCERLGAAGVDIDWVGMVKD